MSNQVLRKARESLLLLTDLNIISREDSLMQSFKDSNEVIADCFLLISLHFIKEWI